MLCSPIPRDTCTKTFLFLVQPIFRAVHLANGNMERDRISADVVGRAEALLRVCQLELPGRCVRVSFIGNAGPSLDAHVVDSPGRSTVHASFLLPRGSGAFLVQ